MAEEGKCPACNNDGWIAVPRWADAGKENILVLKVICNCGMPIDPDISGHFITWEQLDTFDSAESVRPN